MKKIIGVIFLIIGMIHAMEEGYQKEVTRCICIPENLESLDPIEASVWKGGFGTIWELIRCRGFKVDEKFSEGRTVFHCWAAVSKLAFALKFLLEKGANINIQDDQGRTPLHYAAGLNQNVEITRFLIERGANINAQDSGGWMPLHYAGHQNSSGEVMEELVLKGADCSTKTKANDTLYYLARDNPNNTCAWDIIAKALYNRLTIEKNQNIN